MPTYIAFGTGTVLIEDKNSAIRMHDLESGKEIARFEPPEVLAAGPIDMDSTGRYLAVGSRNNQIQLWDLGTLRRRLGELGLDATGL